MQQDNIFGAMALIFGILLHLGLSPPNPQVSTQQARVGEPQLHVFTVITDMNHSGFQNLEASCSASGVHLNVVKSQTPFTFGTMGVKLKQCYDYIRHLPGEDIVMFVDGYDILVYGQPKVILRRFFETVGSDRVALFSAEYNCWPDEDLKPKFPVTRSWYKYLNSGAWISRVDVMMGIFKEYNFFESPEQWAKIESDQRYFTTVFLESLAKGKPMIKLDSFASIFNTRNFYLRKNTSSTAGWFDSHTLSDPVVFHAPGQPKTYLYSDVMPHSSSLLSFCAARQKEYGKSC